MSGLWQPLGGTTGLVTASNFSLNHFRSSHVLILDFSHDFYMFFMFTTIKMGSELVGRGTTEVLQSNTAEDLLTQPTKTGLAGLSNAAEPRSLESTSLKSEAIIQRPFFE